MTPTAPSKDTQPPLEPEALEGKARPTLKTARVERPTPPREMESGFISATHAVLFAPEEPRCDACDGRLGHAEEPRDSGAESGDDEDDGGHGLYVWVRHGQLTYEEPPLCPSCAKAITMSALQRWEIEEEEG